MPRPTATPISGATDWIREAVLIESPERNPSPEVALIAETDQRLPGVDPDAEPERCTAHRGQFLGVLADPQARPHGAFGVVLVGGGNPEDPDDRIPDELLHDPAVRPRSAARAISK